MRHLLPVFRLVPNLSSFLAFSLLLAACGDRYPEHVQLTPEYGITTTSSECAILVRGNEQSASFVLDPTISFWERRGDFLVGEVTQYTHPSPDLTTRPEDLGFFILNLTTGELLKGLSRPDYERKLQVIENK